MRGILESQCFAQAEASANVPIPEGAAPVGGARGLPEGSVAVDGVRSSLDYERFAQAEACGSGTGRGTDQRSSTAQQVARRRRTDPSALVKLLRGDLDWITMKALEKDRTRRYATASALADDIVRHLHYQPVHASPPSTSYRFRKFVIRNKVSLAITILVAIVLAVSIKQEDFTTGVEQSFRVHSLLITSEQEADVAARLVIDLPHPPICIPARVQIECETPEGRWAGQGHILFCGRERDLMFADGISIPGFNHRSPEPGGNKYEIDLGGDNVLQHDPIQPGLCSCQVTVQSSREVARAFAGIDEYLDVTLIRSVEAEIVDEIPPR